MEVITQWLNSPVIVVAIIAVLGILYGSHKLIFRVGEWKSNVDSDRKSFKEFMAEIRIDITAMRKDISNIFNILSKRDVIASKSPLQLTELGDRISKNLNAKNWADRIAQELKERVAEKEAYDIHDICFNYVSNEMETNDEQEKLIKMCAYEMGVDRQQVLTVLAVELRDKLLEQQ